MKLNQKKMTRQFHLSKQTIFLLIKHDLIVLAYVFLCVYNLYIRV